MEPRTLLEYLKRLSHEDYVLHGSPHYLEVIEPKQALCYDHDGTVNEEKSQFGIYASISIETALICALAHGNQGWTIDLDPMRVYVHGKAVTLGAGYIYVLAQKHFKRLSNVAWFVAHEPQKPLRTLEVTPKTLAHLPHVVLPPYLKPAR